MTTAPEPAPVHVIGATGRSGLALVQALTARGIPVVPVVRDAARWIATGRAEAPRIAAIEDGDALAAALEGASRIVSTAHARHTGAVLAAAPTTATRLVLLGSTRRFTRWPDAHGRGVIAGEALLLGSGRPAIMLHPTMIYGATGENNVRRLAALTRRLPALPLPGGGGNLVQPIHQDDVTAAILAALDLAPGPPETLVIAGAAALPYAAFVRAVAHADGQRTPRIIRVPLLPLLVLAPLARRIPSLPPVGRDEIRRLGENKAFDIAPMRRRLGIEPIALAEGLRRTFGTAGYPSG